MRQLRFTAFGYVSIIGLFHYCLLALYVSIGSLTVTGCASKPNQTPLNRPNTVIANDQENLNTRPIDPQIAHISVTRPVRAAEYSAYGLGESPKKWIRTADVIKPVTANWLADYGLPTGRWRKMEYDSDYTCFSEPLNIKGNVIHYRVRGNRDGGETHEHQLTLTVNNHDTLQEAKRVLIEKVEVLYKRMARNSDIEPGIRQRILNEQFVYPSAKRWQPAPDPGFRYHRCYEIPKWTIPFDHGGVKHSHFSKHSLFITTEDGHKWGNLSDHGDVSHTHLTIRRAPLSENGYKWGDPFMMQVIFEPHNFP